MGNYLCLTTPQKDEEEEYEAWYKRQERMAKRIDTYTKRSRKETRLLFQRIEDATVRLEMEDALFVEPS